MALIEFEGVGVTYDSYNNGAGVAALRDVCLEVNEGELVCVIGPSGCGKTTLLNLIAGFISPTAGEVKLDGRPVNGPGPERAMVFQEAALFPWLSVAGNIEFVMRMQRRPSADRRALTRELISLVGLDDFERAYPHELSGGMKQRVALGRALALEPRVLLMDEPFGALDAQTRERLQDELLRIWQQTGTTGVFVTHNVEEAVYLGDHVIVLTQRPGAVLAAVEVDIPRPRERLEASVCQLKRELFELLPTSLEAAAKPFCAASCCEE